MQSNVELGLGTIGIGCEWGAKWKHLPSDTDARLLLESALGLGIRVFDTAPAYGLSEARLGSFLNSLDHATRCQLTVMTKCGVHWDFEMGSDYVDHSYDALCRSIDRSFSLLPQIDVLQLHQASVERLNDEHIWRALRNATARGARELGVSVNTVEAVKLAMDIEEISVIQLPYNLERASFADFIPLAASGARPKKLVINRPFGMGGLLYDQQGVFKGRQRLVDAFSFILQQSFSGVVLVGTTSIQHLHENVAAFQKAQE